MDLKDSKVAGLQVVFGNGPVGSAAARLLLEKGLAVKVVSRTGGRPAGLFDGLSADQERRLTFHSADALDPQAVLAASRGASHIYHSINAPYPDWWKVLPGVQRNIVAAALREKAVLAVTENLYTYSRGVPVINERTPEVPPTRKGLLRKELHDSLVKTGSVDGLVWTSVRASDYYGPGATFQSVFGTQLFLDPLYNGKRPRVVGDPDQPHSFTFVGDFGRALAIAALDPRAYGRAWIVPNDEATTARQAAGIFIQAAGRHTRLSRIPHLMIAAAGVFSPLLRELTEMLYQKEEPYVVDGSGFAERFAFEPTRFAEGVRQTLAWYESTHQPSARAAA